MSLIHDALKKSQNQNPAPMGSGLSTFQDSLVESKPPASKRVIVLVVVLVAAIGFLAYKKFAGPSTPVAVPVPTPGAGAPGQLQPGAPALPADVMKRKAFDAFKTDDVENAWSNIQAAVQAAPQDAESWNNYGVIAKKRGEIEKAREAYNKAIELKPQYPEALNNLALLEMQSDNLPRARELLEKALNISPAYPEANFHMGMIYDRAGEKNKAVEYYKRFLEVSGSFPNTVVENVRDRVMEIEPQ